MAEYKNIRIAVSGIYEYALDELPSLRLSIQDAPDWVERKKIYKVYRPAIVLARAVEKFKMLPLTHEHPMYPVDSQNFRDLIVGYTGENPSVEYIADSDEVGIRSTAMLYDDEAITAYENGETQLSPGYLAEFEWKKGFAPNGQEYDILMKEITAVNHLALLRKGRGGNFAVVLDGQAEVDILDIGLFEFIKIRNELAEFLENSESEDVSVEYAGKPEGSISHRKDGDYRKMGGKWRRVYSDKGRGASISAGRVASKIRKAQTVDELVDLVMNNTSRFTDANGRLLPVVERIKTAVDKRKKELAAEKKSKEAEPAQKAVEKKSEVKSAEPSTQEDKAQLEDLRREAIKKGAGSYEYTTKSGEVIKGTTGRKGGTIKRQYDEEIEKLLQMSRADLEKEAEKLKAQSDEAYQRFTGSAASRSGSQVGIFSNADSRLAKVKRVLARKNAAEQKGEAGSEKENKEVAKQESDLPELKEPKKPDILNGYFNGKIYGNEKYGYRIYIDNKEKKISAKQKSEIENYQKEKSQYDKDVQERKENAPISESAAKETFFDRLSSEFANRLWLNKKNWEQVKEKLKVHKDGENILSVLGVQKLLDKMKTEKKPFSSQLKYKNTSAFENLVEKLKTDDDYRNKFVKEFEDYTDSKVAKFESEKKAAEHKGAERNQRYSDFESKVSDYIKQHGEPSVVKGHFWNGTVYGGERNPHIYLDGKKKYLSESDKKEFGL